MTVQVFRTGEQETKVWMVVNTCELLPA